jgi:hypothetical protein
LGYVPLPEDVYATATKRFEARTVGTVYNENSKGKTLQQLFGS